MNDLPSVVAVALRLERSGIHRVARVHDRHHVLEAVLSNGELGSERGHADCGAAVAEQVHVEFGDDDVTKARADEPVGGVGFFEGELGSSSPRGDVFAGDALDFGGRARCAAFGHRWHGPDESPDDGRKNRQRFHMFGLMLPEVTQPDGCVPGYSERDLLGRTMRRGASATLSDRVGRPCACRALAYDEARCSRCGGPFH